MEIIESKRNGVIILAVIGRLDASTSGSFEDKILGLIASGDTRFVIDCRQLDYISSAGLRVILVAAKRLSPANGAIALAALKEHIQQVFEIAGFSSVLRIFATPDQAVAGIS